MASNNYKLIKNIVSKTPGEWGQVDIHDEGIEMVSTLYLSDDEFKFWNTYLQLYNNLFSTKDKDELFKSPDYIKETYHLIGPLESDNRSKQSISDQFTSATVTAYFKISIIDFNTNALSDDGFEYVKLLLLDKHKTIDVFVNKVFNNDRQAYNNLMEYKPDGYFVYRPFINSPSEVEGLNLYLFNIPVNSILEYGIDYDNYVAYVEKIGAFYYMKLIEYLKSHYNLDSVNLNNCVLAGLFRHNYLEYDFDMMSFKKVTSFNPIELEKIDKIK